MGRKGDITALQDIIEQLDVMLGQVVIEAVILEVILNDSVSYGIDWLQRSYTVWNEEQFGPGGGLTIAEPVAAFGGGQNLSGRDAFIGGDEVSRETPIGAALTYYTSFFDFNIDAVIQMAANSSDARLLSTPVIVTADNTEASITVGEERPVVSTTSTTTAGSIRSSFEYRNIGITLKVTPRINPQRLVVMEITQTADDVGGEVLIDGNPVPIITKREMTAQVAVDSMETIVLGGLVRAGERDSVTKVPILGDIPILGALFRGESKSDDRTELMVLITPYVMMNPQEVAEQTERLHDSTQLHSSKEWVQGWSGSRLARSPSADYERRMEQMKKDRRKRLEKRVVSKAGGPVSLPSATRDASLYEPVLRGGPNIIQGPLPERLRNNGDRITAEIQLAPPEKPALGEIDERIEIPSDTETPLEPDVPAVPEEPDMLETPEPPFEEDAERVEPDLRTLPETVPEPPAMKPRVEPPRADAPELPVVPVEPDSPAVPEPRKTDLEEILDEVGGNPEPDKDLNTPVLRFK
jgi:hypothetical protein